MSRIITSSEEVDALFKHEKKGREYPLMMNLIDTNEWIEVMPGCKGEEESLIREIENNYGSDVHIAQIYKDGKEWIRIERLK
jgi:hypothetical protein